MELLRLDTVTAGYGPRDVLFDASLSVRAGELWAVLGPNGAGKSTLARLSAGLMEPRSGALTVCTLPVPGTPAATLSKSVAWVPQAPSDTLDFTALEVALLGRAPHLGAFGLTSAHDDQQALEALKAFGVDALANRPVRELSGGEARRVWLARAWVQAPKLLVLDEPTAFLDVRHQLAALDAVRAKVYAGLGCVAVLHDVNLAARVATHAVLLKAGRVIAQGRSAEVLTPEQLGALFDVRMELTPQLAPRPR